MGCSLWKIGFCPKYLINKDVKKKFNSNKMKEVSHIQKIRILWRILFIRIIWQL
jgi:hypothetical protein